jgi:hypothetical protein
LEKSHIIFDLSNNRIRDEGAELDISGLQTTNLEEAKMYQSQSKDLNLMKDESRPA